MKKLFSLAIAVIMVFLPLMTVCAETTRMEGNFTIRNDISYHMSREDILKAEREYGTATEGNNNATHWLLDKNSPEGYTTLKAIRYNRLVL